MKTLEEIKDEVAKEQGYLSYREVAEFSYGLCDEAAKRYALEAIKSDRERVADNAKVKCIEIQQGYDPRPVWDYVIDKQSIINLPIELK